ncbi:MAG: MFS transporter [Casimicrobiaceae bacterium]
MLSSALARYRAFLRHPDVPTLLVTALVTRMPVGMLSLSLLLHVRSLTGSFATAGAAVGACLGASAVTGPFLGRIVDRRGPAPVLFATGLVCPLALAVVLFAQRLDLAPGMVIAFAALAGAFLPPISVLTRTMWRHRFDDERTRMMAFSIDGVLIELAFTLGPMIVATLLAAASATAAFAVALGFTAVAAPVFVLSPAIKHWPRRSDEERHLLGPLTEPRLLAVYVVTLLFTFCLGLTEVGYPGYATFAGAPPLAGVLLAINSAGSAAGGLFYGALHLNKPAHRQLPLILAAMTLPIALQAATDSAVVLCVLAFVAGTLIAPVFALTSMLVTSIAPPRYATEAFTWTATCIVSGVGAGQALGGRLLEGPGYPTVFALAAGAALAAALLAWTLRTRALRVRAQT